jgi:hypothetical protein
MQTAIHLLAAGNNGALGLNFWLAGGGFFVLAAGTIYYITRIRNKK